MRLGRSAPEGGPAETDGGPVWGTAPSAARGGEDGVLQQIGRYNPAAALTALRVSTSARCRR